jgi:hypothetical protein
VLYAPDIYASNTVSFTLLMMEIATVPTPKYFLINFAGYGIKVSSHNPFPKNDYDKIADNSPGSACACEM